MAQIRLTRTELQHERLPGVCMSCGQQATLYKNKTFSWFPSWVWVLLLCSLWPFLIVALILTKRMNVGVPLCDAHRYHWVKRNLFAILGLLLCAGLCFGGVLVSDDLDKNGDPALRDTIQSITFGGAGVLFVAWLITICVLQATAIRSVEITDETITLAGVSPRFIDAVKRQLRDEDEYDLPERPPRGGSEQVYDPEARPSNPLPPDAYRERGE
jgi:hypothetical protein